MDVTVNETVAGRVVTLRVAPRLKTAGEDAVVTRATTLLLTHIEILKEVTPPLGRLGSVKNRAIEEEFCE